MVVSYGKWLISVVKLKKTKEETPAPEVYNKVADNNFFGVVMNSGNEALVLFYSPECKHCQKFLPVWDQLADMLKDEEVDIVRIDAVNNEWPRDIYKVHSFPTIYWKSLFKSMEPERYTDRLYLQNLIKFVSRKAAKELKGWDRGGNPKKRK